MENLPKYYTTLFNAVTDAIELISRSEVSEAMACLVAAQQKAEEIYGNTAQLLRYALPGGHFVRIN